MEDFAPAIDVVNVPLATIGAQASNAASTTHTCCRERVDKTEHRRWIEAVPDGAARKLVEQRSRELVILWRLPDGGLGAVDGLGAWSDWLQRRAAETLSDAGILARLASEGRTRKVRALAAERLRGIE